MKQEVVEGTEAPLALGDRSAAEELLEVVASVPRGRRSPYLEAQRRRLTARMAEDDSADGLFRDAAARFREFGLPFWLAVASIEHAEWLAGRGRGEDAEPLRTEAASIFENLGSPPWRQRAAALRTADPRETVLTG